MLKAEAKMAVIEQTRSMVAQIIAGFSRVIGVSPASLAPGETATILRFRHVVMSAKRGGKDT
ncbi:MAG TPA: hypothetical protein VFX03_08855 [Thermomicrobiales bacterium]|nr:hypothetical protein [Thermomicrobiales bacterium]